MRKNRRITPEGTRDLLFEECLARREVETRLTDLFVQRGFSEVMTPGIEFYDVVPGDNEAIPPESVYKLTDTKGRLLAVRPDSTMPIARLTATRLQNARLPIRLYYAQDVFRLNHGMAGHNDQIFQAGVELIGAAGERADLEMISLAAQSLRSCAGEKFRLEIGHVGVFRSLVEQLAVEPEVLLMDEPTSALDPISTSKIEDLAMELKNEYTIIMVTHNMQQAARISDKTAFFLLGDMVEYGDTEKLFSFPQDKRTEEYITGRFG